MLDSYDQSFRQPLPSIRNRMSDRLLTKETDAHFLLSMDMPGVCKDDLNIHLNGNELTIEAERKDDGIYQMKFQESVTVPKEFVADKIEAEFKDGVLRIAIPKVEAAKPRQISISDGKTGVFARLFGRVKKEETRETLSAKEQTVLT